MHLLFPSDYFKHRQPDEMYAPEAAQFAEGGFLYSTVNTDSLSSSKPLPRIPSESSVLYRGWMLNKSDYGQLANVIATSGGKLITDLETYLLAHHIPNWCELISDLTPETVVLPLGSDFEAELKHLNWSSFFVKDYVKSLKTSMGSIVTDPSQIGTLVEEMEKFRGMIEGGLCVRRVESYEDNTEVRYFVVDSEPYGPDTQPIPGIVRDCAERIRSPFFSIDVAKRVDGKERVVEIGDGQVSDLVGWTLDRFVDIWST